MKCSVCKKELGIDAIRLNEDSDYACSIECEEKYILDKDMFFNNMRNPNYNYFEGM